MLISIRWRNPIFSFRVPQAKEDWLLLQGHRHPPPCSYKICCFYHASCHTNKKILCISDLEVKTRPANLCWAFLLSSKASDVEHASECLRSVTNASFKQVIFWHEKQNQQTFVSIFKEISGIMKTGEPSVDTSCEQNISIFASQKKQQI